MHLVVAAGQDAAAAQLPKTVSDRLFLMTISAPICLKLSCTSSCTFSRSWLPLVTPHVKLSRSPSLTRIPSSPGAQPASSRIFFACSGSYDTGCSCVFCQGLWSQG